MAINIPQYQQRTSPETGGISANAHSDLVASPVGSALEGFGREVSKGTDALGDALQKKEDADAAVQASKIIADAHESWSQFRDSTYNAATDGAPDFTKNVMDAYHKWAGETENTITNPVGKHMLQQGLNNLRTHLYDTSAHMEAQAGVANRLNSLTDISDQYSRAVYSGQMSFDQAKSQTDYAIANAGLDPVSQAKFAISARQNLANSQIQGYILRDPELAKTALDQAHTGGFDSALEFTYSHEGGYKPASADNSEGETNRGIDKKYHPNVDVKNLTKSQSDEIYRNEYWNAIGGDELAKKNPALATAVFDTAVHSGVEKAKELLAKSGGNVNTFVTKRQEFLNNLIAKNPEKYGKFEKGWNNRINDLRRVVNQTIPSDIKSAMNHMDPSKISSYINVANAQINRNQSGYRAQIGSTEADHLTAFTNGNTVENPLTHADFVRAYGNDEGTQRYENYSANMGLSSDIQAVKTMPLDKQMDFLQAKMPNPNQEGYALATKRYDLLRSTVDNLNTARVSDPIGYAVQNNIGGAQPLTVNDPIALGKQISGRTGVAQVMNAQYGAPYTLLSKSEASSLSAGLNNMSADGKLAYINSIQKNMPDANNYMTLMRQLAPNSPVTAMAGVISNKQGKIVSDNGTFDPTEVARTILRGESLLNPIEEDKKFYSKTNIVPPKDDLFKEAVDDIIGNAYAGRGRDFDLAYNAIKSYYVALSDKYGDSSGGDNGGALTRDAKDRIKQAVTAVTGGITDYNGNGNVVMPWGMNEAEFGDKINTAFKAKMESIGFNKDIHYGLQNVGDGRYVVKNGTTPLIDYNNNPIILDLNAPNYGNRPDGTPKGSGYFGELKLPNGGVATEYSMQSDAVKVNGKRIDFPTLVPTLTPEERDLMINDIIPNGKQPPDAIAQKAVDYAQQRLSQGKNVFAQPNDMIHSVTAPVYKNNSLSTNKMKDK